MSLKDPFESKPEDEIFLMMKTHSAMRERVYSKALHGSDRCKRLCLRWEEYCHNLPTIEEVFRA